MGRQQKPLTTEEKKLRILNGLQFEQRAWARLTLRSESEPLNEADRHSLDILTASIARLKEQAQVEHLSLAQVAEAIERGDNEGRTGIKDIKAPSWSAKPLFHKSLGSEAIRAITLRDDAQKMALVRAKVEGRSAERQAREARAAQVAARAAQVAAQRLAAAQAKIEAAKAAAAALEQAEKERSANEKAERRANERAERQRIKAERIASEKAEKRRVQQENATKRAEAEKAYQANREKIKTDRAEAQKARKAEKDARKAEKAIRKAKNAVHEAKKTAAKVRKQEVPKLTSPDKMVDAFYAEIEKRTPVVAETPQKQVTEVETFPHQPIGEVLPEMAPPIKKRDQLTAIEKTTFRPLFEAYETMVRVKKATDGMGPRFEQAKLLYNAQLGRIANMTGNSKQYLLDSIDIHTKLQQTQLGGARRMAR